MTIEINPTLLEDAARALDEADDRWQHGVGNSGAPWDQFVVRAVLAEISDEWEQSLQEAEIRGAQQVVEAIETAAASVPSEKDEKEIEVIYNSDGTILLTIEK